MKTNTSTRLRQYLVTYMVTGPEIYRIRAASAEEAEEAAFSEGEFVRQGDKIDVNPIECQVEAET